MVVLIGYVWFVTGTLMDYNACKEIMIANIKSGYGK